MGKQTGAIRFTGKLANVVGYRTTSGEGIRERITEVRNPKSAGQNVQRMILATTSISMSYLTKVLNNAVKGKTYGNPTLNYLRKVWMNELRADIANQGGANSRFNVKGENNFALNNYLLSKGSLQGIKLDSFTVGSMPLIFVYPQPAQIESATFSQLFPSVKLGHQITVVGAFRKTDTGEILIGYARFAAKTNENPFLIPGSEEGLYKINPAAINTTLAEGTWRNIQFEVDDSNGETYLHPMVAEGADMTTPILAAAVIVSDKISGNRSTARLQLASNIEGTYPANWESAADSYGASGSQIELPVDAYLDNSVDNPVDSAAEEVALDIVKIYDTRDPIVQEPVQRDSLFQESSYVIRFNKDVTNATFESSSNKVTKTSATGTSMVIAIAALTDELHFNITVDGQVFGGFIGNT